MNPISSDLRALASRVQKPTRDGIVRGEQAERDLDAAYRTVFAGEAGRAVLHNLMEITMLQPLLPSVSDQELRHMEGMRALAAIIFARATSIPKE